MMLVAFGVLQSHGAFVPYNLTSGQAFSDAGWTTCFGSYDCPADHAASAPSGGGGGPGRALLGKSSPISPTACRAPPCWRTSYAEINRAYAAHKAKYGISNCM